jgi:hypothetical protein
VTVRIDRVEGRERLAIRRPTRGEPPFRDGSERDRVVADRVNLS